MPQTLFGIFVVQIPSVLGVQEDMTGGTKRGADIRTHSSIFAHFIFIRILDEEVSVSSFFVDAETR